MEVMIKEGMDLRVDRRLCRAFVLWSPRCSSLLESECTGLTGLSFPIIFGLVRSSDWRVRSFDVYGLTLDRFDARCT